MNGTLESRLQHDNTRMMNYIRSMREEINIYKRKIEKQQETIQGMRGEIGRVRDFLNTRFKLDT